jgi:hypothetical protein
MQGCGLNWRRPWQRHPLVCPALILTLVLVEAQAEIVNLQRSQDDVFNEERHLREALAVSSCANNSMLMHQK